MAQYEQYTRVPLYYEGNYLEMLRKLFPRGPIWGLIDNVVMGLLQSILSTGTNFHDVPDGDADSVQDLVFVPDPGVSTWSKILSCLAAELARIERRAWDLWNESVSGNSTELLPEWEKMFGLPNHCTIAISDMTTRQRTVQTFQYRSLTTATTQFYIDYAASLGMGITLVKSPSSVTPSIAGVARAGFNRCATRGSNCVYTVTVNSGADLATLQCIFSDIKPAHVIFLWVDHR